MPLSQAFSETYGEYLGRIIEEHDRIRAAQSDLEAARNRAREALGPLFPQLETTVNYGWEGQEKPLADDTSTSFKEFDLSLTQLLWDFGATNAAVERARLQVSEKEVALVSERQNLIEETATAYANLRRAYQVLKFARQSEDNIRRQTGLEQARVEAGAGLSTDVLQAKTQLAGAEARRIAAEGGLIMAENRFRALFGETPPDLAALDPIAVGPDLVPPSIDTAVGLVEAHNAQLRLAMLREAIARQSMIETKRSEFTPTIEAVAERKWKRDVGGTYLYKGETLAKVEVTFPFNLGFVAVNTLRAAESDLLAETRRVADTRRIVEEQLRNAWQQFETARATMESRYTQAEIAGAFLDLARRERSLGQRSLIDVLSGETSLINAQSEAVAAETDVIIAVFGLLKVIGQLQPGVFSSFAGSPPGPTDRQASGS